MSNKKHKASVQEFYREYTPRIDFAKYIKRYLASVPSSYLKGLEKVVLTNSEVVKEDLSDNYTDYYGEEIPTWECRGLYFPLHGGRQAWILIIADNILEGWSEMDFIFKVSPIGDLLLCDSFFHEVGHHIHAMVNPEEDDKEKVAERWRIWLKRRYMTKRYWYLFPLLPLAWLLGKLLRVEELTEK